jgi:hypothetical protein
LACAARLPGVEKVATIASPVPSYLLGNGPVDPELFRQENEAEIKGLVADMREKGPQVLLEHLWPNIRSGDKRVIGMLGNARTHRNSNTGLLLASYVEAVEFGDEGWVEDSQKMKNDLGFGLGDVVGPNSNLKGILIACGDRDPFSSREEGNYLVNRFAGRHIPVSEFYIPDSHFPIGFETLGEILAWCKKVPNISQGASRE